jgi:crotonobetainyl-CoA:carnitine CoA-transferase CaiB-like acyl-CoA transferase
LNAAIEQRLIAHSSAEWIERLNAAGVPCGPIYAIDQTFADPQVQHLGAVQTVQTADGGALPMVAQPMALSRTPSRLAARPPERGEHTDEVLAAFGFSEQEIADLHRGNVV